MQRVYFEEKLSGNSATISDKEIAHRLSSVLRMKPGDQFNIFDIDGVEYLAEITAISSNKVSVGFVKLVTRDTESKLTVNLFPALFKKQRFEWMLEKCTELGVAGFYPVAAEHSVVQEHSGASAGERWKKILVSAAEQSERAKVPSVHNTQTLAAAVEALSTAGKKICIAAERSPSTIEWENVPSISKTDIVNLFIGPEGGWAPKELEFFKKHDAAFLSFGSRILRAETACIAGAALLLTNT